MTQHEVFEIDTNFADQISEERKKFGSMMPKHGVYFVPDKRVVSFLKMMREIEKECLTDKNYPRIHHIRSIIKHWKSREEQRQIHNMKVAQRKELEIILKAQEVQMIKFN